MIAVKAIRVCATKLPGMPCAVTVPAACSTRSAMPPLPGKCSIANMPIARNASSFTSDSSATASTMPRWCSVASIWRVPNRMANSASSAATYSAGSVSAPPSPPGASTATLIATALNCSATYGTAAVTATPATSAASPGARP